MGLYSFSGSHPTQADALVAKNYCNQEELEALNGIVSAYLEFAEMQDRRHIPMYMKDWIGALDEFLNLSKHEILTGVRRISATMAEKKAKDKYHKFRLLQDSQLTKSDKDFMAALESAENELTSYKADKES